MRILFLGDVVGKPGRFAVRDQLPSLRRDRGVDFVIANAENASGGVGLTVKGAEELFRAGVDVLTSGNHIWRHREIYPRLDQEPRLLRPANYPPGAPGRGAGVFATTSGEKIAVLNLLGRTFMEPVDCPFRAADALLAALPPEPRVRLVDFHAEATSEKLCLGFWLDGRVSAVIGTHTHVQTNDARVLPGGTATLCDAGMCGVQASALGMDPGNVLDRFLTTLPQRFKLAKGEPELRGAVVDADVATGAATGIELV